MVRVDIATDGMGKVARAMDGWEESSGADTIEVCGAEQRQVEEEKDAGGENDDRDHD